MKKLALMLAVLQVLLCLTGCGGGGEKLPETTVDTISYSYPEQIPTYADDKQMELVAFWSPPSTLEHYQWMADCGFTSVVIDAKYDNILDSQTLMDTLTLCDQVGLTAYPAVGRGQALPASDAYAEHPSFGGFYTDEPLSLSDFSKIQSNIEAMNKRFPDGDYTYLTTLINDAPTAYNNDFSSFEEYIESYMAHGGAEQKAFLYDYYPLCGNAVKSTIGDNWLPSLEAMTEVAHKYDVQLWSYIATMSFSSGNRRRPAEDDLRYQSYVSLAYGAKGLAMFCYMSPGGPPYDGEFKINDWALVNYEDIDDISTYYRTETWYSMQNVNNELKAFDHVLLSFDWQGVMKCVGSDASTSAGENNFRNAKNWTKHHDGIKSLKATEDAILGLFQDENGYDGFLLVNFADPGYDRTNDVTLELRGATRALVYAQGQNQIVDLTDGVYSVTLQPGEGQFIIPLA